MERILLNINIFLFAIYFYKKIRHGLHILQLENYYNDRYAVWMKKNIKIVLDIKVIGMLIIPVILVAINQDTIANVLEILAFLVLILTTKKKIEKKPFVVTSRIRRIYLTFLLLLAIVIIVCNMSNLLISFILINFLSIIKAIRRRFCRLAHKKLKEIPGLKVIGITGSYGKTSTKYIVNTILSQKYNTLMTPESYNTTMGVVRTINEKLSSTHQLFIWEMGAKYIGDIKEICDIVDPNYRYFNSYRTTAFRYF